MFNKADYKFFGFLTYITGMFNLVGAAFSYFLGRIEDYYFVAIVYLTLFGFIWLFILFTEL